MEKFIDGFMFQLLGVRNLEGEEEKEEFIRDCFSFNQEEVKGEYIEELFIKYGLSFDNILVEKSIHPYMFPMDKFYYSHRGFIFDIRLYPNMEDMFRMLSRLKVEFDSYFIDKSDKYSGRMWLLFECTPKSCQSFLFNMMASYLRPKELTEIGEHIFISSDYGSSNLWSNVVGELFKKDLDKLDEFVDEDGLLTIYRGERNQSKPYWEAYSWTLDEEIASFFADRFATKGEGRVYKLKVRKEFISGFVGGNEKEVILIGEDFDFVDIEEIER